MPQDLVHRAETAMSGRLAKLALAFVAVLGLAVAYHYRQARNFATQEAMDSAQLARNIAEGRGFTTQFIRPFSMFLVKRANQERIDSLTKEQRADLSLVKGDHPDISNAPGYPLLLAGWMKLAPFRFEVNLKEDEQFTHYQPDLLITILNQLLLAASGILVFLLTRKLFDVLAAQLSTILFFGSEILWRFSASGLSTMLLLLLFLLLVWALVRLEAVFEDANATMARVLAGAFVVGLLLALGLLTRYSFGALLLPVVIYLGLFGGRWRLPAILTVLLVFAAISIPWAMRNMWVCGMPFGTATYAPVENSIFFQQHRLERSLQPNFMQVPLATVWWKFFANLRVIALNDLPRLGGSWVLGFFLAGLLVTFRNPVLRRLRWFTLMGIVTLIGAQALVRTALSADSPEVNSENLIVLLLPLIVIYGVSFFLTLLDQIPLPEEMIVPLVWIRRTVIGAFLLVCSLPLLASFLPGRTSYLTYHSAVAFPPYYPPDIQKVSNWMNRNELVMSDVPWAVAWYGNRQCIWLTLDSRGQFYTLTDYVKPVNALYLSPAFLDSRYFSQWVADRHGEGTWGDLIIHATTSQTLPEGFPLVKAYRLNAQIFLSDWERWLRAEDSPPKKIE
jgi:hypothetical protein